MSGITNPAEEYFKDGIWGWAATLWEKLKSSGGRLFTALHGWDGSAWRKLPLVFGYSDAWKEDLGGTKSGAGNYQVFSAVVAPGFIYVLQVCTLSNNTGARGRILLEIYDGSTFYRLEGAVTPVPYETVLWSGQLVLKAGDYAVVTQHSCLNGDVLKGSVLGYKMKIAE